MKAAKNKTAVGRLDDNGLVLGQFLRRRGFDFRAVVAGLFLRSLLQLALRAFGFLHFAFFHPLHFFLALLKCRGHGFSPRDLRDYQRGSRGWRAASR